MPSATCFLLDEEEEIDIMNHSDEEEPLPDFPLCDTLPLPDIIPVVPSLKYTSTSQQPHIGRPKGSKVKVPCNDVFSESSDDSDEDTREFMKDIKARDYWERFERRMYQEQAEKRSQASAQRWLAGNRRASSQIQKDKDFEKLVTVDIFAPLPEDIEGELEDVPLAIVTTTFKDELKTPSFREVPGYDIHDGYDDEATFQFLRGYKDGRLNSEWHEPELAFLSPKKVFSSYTRGFSDFSMAPQVSLTPQKKKKRFLPPRNKGSSVPTTPPQCSPVAEPPLKRRALSDMRTARSKARRDLAASSMSEFDKDLTLPDSSSYLSVPDLGLDLELFVEPLSITPPLSPSLFFDISPAGSPDSLTSSDLSPPSDYSFCEVSIKEEPFDDFIFDLASSMDAFTPPPQEKVEIIKPVVVKKEKPKKKKKKKAKSKEGPSKSQGKVIIAKKVVSKEICVNDIVVESEEVKIKKKEKVPKEKKEEEDSALDNNARRAKRFCMSPQVQKHFQLTLWYEEEKMLFKELFCAFGRDWAHISTLMNGTKSPTQIKNFYYDVRRSLLASLFGLSPEELSKEYVPPATIVVPPPLPQIKIEEIDALDEPSSPIEEFSSFSLGTPTNTKKRSLDFDKEKNCGNDKDKAGPPKKKSKSGNMVFKSGYRVPPRAPSDVVPTAPSVGASVFCQYRHAPGWVEASVLSLKGTGDEMKAKLLVKGLPHYRAFWATLSQIFYTLDEGVEVFEYSAEDSEIEKNNMPPNNTYTPTLPSMAPANRLLPVHPPSIDPAERKVVAVEENVKPLLESLVPVDRNKLHQWLENKLESMNAITASGASASPLSKSTGCMKDKVAIGARPATLNSVVPTTPQSLESSLTASIDELFHETDSPIPSPDSPLGISLPAQLSSPSPVKSTLSMSAGMGSSTPGSNPSAQLLAMNARYKSYLECTNTLFEEKDLVSINFASVFTTTTTLGKFEAPQWVRRDFDTFLSAIDQGVSMIMSRSARKCAPVQPSPSPATPKKQAITTTQQAASVAVVPAVAPSPTPVANPCGAAKIQPAPIVSPALAVQPPKNVATVVINSPNSAPITSSGNVLKQTQQLSPPATIGGEVAVAAEAQVAPTVPIQSSIRSSQQITQRPAAPSQVAVTLLPKTTAAPTQKIIPASTTFPTATPAIIAASNSTATAAVISEAKTSPQTIPNQPQQVAASTPVIASPAAQEQTTQAVTQQQPAVPPQPKVINAQQPLVQAPRPAQTQLPTPQLTQQQPAPTQVQQLSKAVLVSSVPAKVLAPVQQRLLPITPATLPVTSPSLASLTSSSPSVAQLTTNLSSIKPAPVNVTVGVAVNSTIAPASPAVNKGPSPKVKVESDVVTAPSPGSPPVPCKPLCVSNKLVATAKTLPATSQTHPAQKMVIPCVTSVPHKPVVVSSSNVSATAQTVQLVALSSASKATVTPQVSGAVQPSSSTSNTTAPVNPTNIINTSNINSSAPTSTPCMPAMATAANTATIITTANTNNKTAVSPCNSACVTAVPASTPASTPLPSTSSPTVSVTEPAHSQPSSQSTYLPFDKSPVPYKLFIAKRELLLEIRRLLRSMCEHISNENKKNIEEGSTTEGILGRMGELTRQLESYKLELLMLASERYTVFKESFQTADNSIHNVIA